MEKHMRVSRELWGAQDSRHARSSEVSCTYSWIQLPKSWIQLPKALAADLWLMSPPCQPFTRAGKRPHFGFSGVFISYQLTGLSNICLLSWLMIFSRIVLSHCKSVFASCRFKCPKFDESLGDWCSLGLNPLGLEAKGAEKRAPQDNNIICSVQERSWGWPVQLLVGPPEAERPCRTWYGKYWNVPGERWEKARNVEEELKTLCSEA